MDDQTRSALVEAGGKLLVPVMREVVVREYDMRTLKRRNQYEIDKLRKKQEVMDEQAATLDGNESPSPSPSPESAETTEETAPDDTPAETPEQDEVAAAFEELKAKEDCPICSTVLDGLRDLPPKQRIQGMSEYGRFKSFAEDPDVTEDQLVAKIQEMPILRQVIEQEVGAAAPPEQEQEQEEEEAASEPVEVFA